MASSGAPATDEDDEVAIKRLSEALKNGMSNFSEIVAREAGRPAAEDAPAAARPSPRPAHASPQAPRGAGQGYSGLLTRYRGDGSPGPRNRASAAGARKSPDARAGRTPVPDNIQQAIERVRASSIAAVQQPAASATKTPLPEEDVVGNGIEASESPSDDAAELDTRDR